MELPPLTPVSTAYQGPQLVGPACGATPRAPWPAGVPRRPDGPRGQAPVALCPGAYRLSQRTTQQGREEIGGIPMSVATVSQGEQAMTAVVVAPVEEARPEGHEHAVAHLDETSWRQGDKRGGLWVAVTRWVTVCVVRLSRGGDRARALLGETFAGMWVTDRSRAYNWYPVRWRQRCWAHGLRDGAAMQRRGGAAEALGVAWLAHAHPMCAWWQRVREGT
jgi:transposase